jgi:hypothetical protein
MSTLPFFSAIPKSPFCAVLVLLMATALAAPGRAQEGNVEPWSVKKLVGYHQSLKDSLEVQDVYKLLYQANFGPEHLMADSSTVLEYLREELSSMDTIARQGEDLIERISTRGDMVRINLRPYRHLGLSPGLLVHIMMESARETVPDSLMFYRQWNEFFALVRYGVLNFSPDDLEKWDAQVQRGEITAVHHSPAYRRANAPAYRVARFNVAQENLPVDRP